MSVKELSGREKRIADLLSRAGLNDKIARIVVFLSVSGESSSRDIERGADLRQPEVSLAMNDLREMGWVKERDVKLRRKGRPTKLYKLTLDLKDIASEVINKKEEELKKIKQDLEELRKLVGM